MLSHKFREQIGITVANSGDEFEIIFARSCGLEVQRIAAGVTRLETGCNDQSASKLSLVTSAAATNSNALPKSLLGTQPLADPAYCVIQEIVNPRLELLHLFPLLGRQNRTDPAIKFEPFDREVRFDFSHFC